MTSLNIIKKTSRVALESLTPYKCFKTPQKSPTSSSTFQLKMKSQLEEKGRKLKLTKFSILFKFRSESEDSNGSQKGKRNGRGKNKREENSLNFSVSKLFFMSLSCLQSIAFFQPDELVEEAKFLVVGLSGIVEYIFGVEKCVSKQLPDSPFSI